MTFDPKVTWCPRDHDDDADPIEADIKLRPGFSAHVYPDGAKSFFISVVGEHRSPNACYRKPPAWPEGDTRQWYERSDTFTSGIDLMAPDIKNEDDLAIALLVARIVSEVHEEIEFTKLRGQRLAEPHPTGADIEVWDWLYGRVEQLVQDYIVKFPIESP